MSRRENIGGFWLAHLRMHIISQHPDASKQFEENPDNGQSTLLDPSLGLINKKAQNAWLDWVCNDLMPFSFVDLPRTRKYSNLSPICRNTLTNYLNLVTLEVENAIKDQLPDKFAIAIDGWTTGRTHFVGIMAIVPKESSYETMLSAFTPLIDETCMNSAEHCRLIEETLELYGKDLDNVVAFICDNCELNKSICETSNLLERFFSVAGLALTNLRQRLTPEHLEQQLFLKANSKLWNIHTISKVLNKEN